MSDYLGDQITEDPTANYIAHEKDELGENVDFFTKDELNHMVHPSKTEKHSSKTSSIINNDIDQHQHQHQHHQSHDRQQHEKNTHHTSR
ncbi:unnamed protein product [Cunninghamella echinulata]